MDGMTTFEMSVLFNADSEETAVEAVDSLGAAFTEHLTGWAASIKSIRTEQDEAAGLPESVQTFKPPVTITTEHWDERPGQMKPAPEPRKLIDMPEIIEMAERLNDQQPRKVIDLDIEGNDPEFIVTERLSDQEAEVGDPAYEDNKGKEAS